MDDFCKPSWKNTPPIIPNHSHPRCEHKKHNQPETWNYGDDSENCAKTTSMIVLVQIIYCLVFSWNKNIFKLRLKQPNQRTMKPNLDNLKKINRFCKKTLISHNLKLQKIQIETPISSYRSKQTESSQQMRMPNLWPLYPPTQTTKCPTCPCYALKMADCRKIGTYFLHIVVIIHIRKPNTQQRKSTE